MKVLISLVGSNPLPIYTVCRYASMENRSEEDKKILPVPDKYIFVYTNNTQNYYENIIDLLENKIEGFDEKHVELNLKDNHHYGDEIKKQIDEEIKRVDSIEKIDTIVLNNTGGTKPMAVYSTIAIEEFAREKFAREKVEVKEFECYLDSARNVICVNSILDDNIDASTSYCPKDYDLREALKDTNIVDIIKLHGLDNEENEKIVEKSYDNLAGKNSFIIDKESLKEFAKIVCENDKWKEFKEFVEPIEIIEKATINKKNNAIKELNEILGVNEEDLKEFYEDKYKTYTELTSNYKEKCHYISKTVAEEEKLNWIKSALPIFDDTSKYSSNPKAKNFYKYITGIWLEHYLQIAIEDAVNQLGLNENVKLYQSLVCKLVKGKDKPEFEIDLVVLKGYQIIAFTCTVADEESPYLLKGKGFEGLHRVEQLGGEHAKVVIVTMSNDKERVKEEMKSFNSNFYKELDVITRNELGSYNYLVERLKGIIKN